MRSILILQWLAALPISLALKATPESNCASLCIDNPALDATSLSSYNTFTTDLTCSDAMYNQTEAGQKFEACNNCLQDSTSSDASITDVGAYLYNLRATLAGCLFGFPNTTSTINSPCNIDYSCLPLAPALKLAIGSPENISSQYDYCTTNGSVFQSKSLVSCVQCFTSSSQQTYLGNFLVALEAGCRQQPGPGRTISISGSPFTTTLIDIVNPSTYADEPVTDAPVAVPVYRSTGFIIGIVALVVIILAIVLTILLIRRRRRLRREAMKRKRLNSDYDERYGAGDISFPNDGFAHRSSGESGKNSVTSYEMHEQKAGLGVIVVDEAARDEQYAQSEKPARTAISTINFSNPRPLGSNPTTTTQSFSQDSKDRGPVHPAYRADIKASIAKHSSTSNQGPDPSRASLSQWSESEGDLTPVGKMPFLRGKAKAKMLPRITVVPEHKPA